VVVRRTGAQRTRGRRRARLGVLLAVLGGLLLLAYRLTRGADVDFREIAPLPPAQAAAEIRQRTGGAMRFRVNGGRVLLAAQAIPPGRGYGVHPRFINIGPSPMALYQGEANKGEWYVVGVARVMDHVAGSEWKDLGTVQGQRYVYQPPK
jgi:hypothetical protein